MNAIACSLFLALLLAGGGGQPPGPAAAGAPPPIDAAEWVELKGGLRYRDVVVGTGAEARSGRLLQVHYTGWLATGGEPFDSSRRTGRAYAFTLGAGTVVAGWDKGLVGMRVGGKRELLVPAKMGYGSRGVPGRIPPGAELRFEIELLAANQAPR